MLFVRFCEQKPGCFGNVAENQLGMALVSLSAGAMFWEATQSLRNSWGMLSQNH